MTGAACFLLLLQIFCMMCCTWSQRSPYSLQAAVDELHRREAAKYPLNSPPPQQRYLARALGTTGEQDYWDDDSDNSQNRNRHRLNKALAKYLERESYDNDHSGLSLGPFGGYEFKEDNNQIDLEEKKRASYFRERDNKYDLQPSSAFRERETQTPPGAGISIPEHSELTEQFLKEIEEAQEHEREERYKDALRNLWEKYQQQENEIEGDLFAEKKRVRIPPYYMLMQKKRSYPVLPWLPYAERKKRIPVAKRSTKQAINESNNLGKTDDKVAKELSELFGSGAASTTGYEKKKRSINEEIRTSSTRAPTTASTTDMLLEVPSKKDNATEAATSVDAHDGHQHEHEHAHEHSGHAQKKHKHRKRSDHHGSHDGHEEGEEEGSKSEEHEEEEGEDEDEEEFEEEEAEGRKKKRDLKETKRLSFKLPYESARLSKLRQKKSIDWSTYFGLDRKKKSVKRENGSGIEVKKRSASDDNADNTEQEKKKRDLSPEKIDNMDRKLQSIEDFIIDETIKYTGAHEGMANPDEIRRLKDHVLSRLATAYSLEKMRRALDKLRQSVETENHLLRNVIEPEDHSENELEKRLSVKKEQATDELENIVLQTDRDKTKEIHSNSMMSTSTTDTSNKSDDSMGDGNEDSDAMKKHKKKRNGYLRYPDLPNEFTDTDEDIGPGHYESLNDAYLGNKNYIIGSNQCPLIESMAERCRGVDLLSGDINQELLPICGIHQICYLCGTSQVACDYQYLAEADSICGNNNDCQAAARSILMVLRGTPAPQLGPRECLKNSCLHGAMREIGL
ncbi:neurofilament medium polypeptide [Eurosta solidaginis]|uniref:neurofilament medium polypeptide n=1 Tax=Eurosta solidaginis TaxID=178769 RepID=UPI0035313B25